MKLLVIGLDGMDRSLADRFDMPALRAILDENESMNIQEDLWSRGWSKILCGLNGTETGAVYEKPKADGTAAFTQSFGSGSYSNLSNPPLWQSIEESGQSAGWLYAPTTMPAVPINGFMISGAGGGVSPSDRIPIKACHPQGLARTITQARSIWENRFIESGQRSADTYIPTCIDALWKRATLFSELVRDHNIKGLGFIVQKESVLVTNVFMHDIVADRPPMHSSQYATRQLLKSLFSALDDTIDYLVQTLQPDNVAIVSDHGAAPYKTSINLNVLLENQGLVSFPKLRKPGWKKHVKKAARWTGRKLLSDDVVEEDRWIERRQRINHKTSKAFSHFYIPGVYINDERFGGPVTSQEEKSKLIRQIIESIESNESLSHRGIAATPFKETKPNSPVNKILPDVWVTLPEDVFPEHFGGLLSRNPLDRHWFDLTRLPRDIGSGKKSADALCSFPKTIVDRLPLEEFHGDLRDAYHCINAAF